MGSDDNEKDSATLDDSTSRTIKLTDSGGRELFSMTRPATQGTPQKCLYHLASTCRDLLMEKREKGGVFNVDKGTLKYKNNTKVNDVLDAIFTLPRDWWKKKNTNLEVVNQLVTSAMKVYSGDTEKIAQMYSNILFKSLSDISQYGALLTNMADIETREKYIKDKQQGGDAMSEYDVIKSLYKSTYIGVSSDKIGAALMTMVASVFDYNFEILSTYKYAGMSINSILIKEDVAGLALFMRGEGSTVDKLIKQNKLGLSDTDKTMIVGLRQQCLGVINNYKTQVKIKNMDTHINDLFKLASSIKKMVRQSDVNKHPELEKIVAYARLIKELSKIISGENMTIIRKLFVALRKYETKKTEDKKFINCETYLYHIAKNMHNLLFPLNTHISSEKKEQMSRQEIIAACYDNIYGHDFSGLDFIATLGKKFISQVFANTPDKSYLLSQDAINKIETKGVDQETTCIHEAIKHSKYVSVGLVDGNMSFFIGDKNALTYTYPTIQRDNCMLMTLFKTVFDNKNYFYSIDFYAGAQPYEYGKSTVFNILNGYVCNKRIIEINLEQHMKEYKKELERLKQKGLLPYEIFTPATYYDGAANYGLYEIIISKPYTTKYSSKSYTINITTKTDVVKEGNIESFVQGKYKNEHTILSLSLIHI